MNERLHDSLDPLIRRLEHSFNPLSSEQKRKKLVKRIDYYLEKFSLNPDDITKVSPLIQIRDTDQILPANTEENQAMLAGMFFALNRQQYNEAIFDKKKEYRQIEAVAAFLSGFHLQMGTGEGKSTAVFPIVALVESLTNQKRAAILATSDESNLGDLEESTRKLINLAGHHNINISGIAIEKSPQKQAEDSSFQQQMVVEALTEGKYSKETENRIKKSYWQSILGESGSQYDFLYRKKDDVKPRVVLATDRDLVFSFADDGEKFLAETPEIYMDEADIPYNRKTPYKQTPPTVFFTPQEVENSTLSWLAHRLIWQQLKPDDFKPGEKGYELTQEAMDRVKSLRFSQIIEKKPSQFDQAITLIAKKLGLDEKQRALVKDRLLKLLKTSDDLNSQIKVDEEIGDQTLAQTIYEGIARRLAGFYKKSGVFYKSSGQKGISVRDHYIDQILEDHHFTPDDQIAILAIEKQYDFVALDQTAKMTLTFPTFTNAIKDKLHCASGTLKFPNSETKKIEETNFSRFLRNYTGRRVYDVTQPEIKDLPRPKILDTDEDTVEQLAKGVEEIKGKKPTLVISYDIDSSLKIFNRLKKTFKKRVQYVPTKPSSPKDVADYNKKVKNYYRQLADGELDVLVSSGASGFAVNIVGSDGSYPDLHIALHNLPANRQLLMQNLNRRRKEGSEFSWYVSREHLDLYMMMFEEKTDLLSHFLGKVDALDIKQRLEKAKENPEAALQVILDILKQSERFEAADDEFLVLYDNLVNEQSRKLADNISKKLSGSDGLEIVRRHPVKAGKEENFLNMFASQLGLPEKLYQDLRDYLPLVLPNIPDSDMRVKLNKAIATRTINDLLSETATEWYRQRLPITDEIVRINYDSIALLDHIPFNTRLIKSLPIPVSDAKTGNQWVQIYFNDQFHLGYTTPLRQVYLLFNQNTGRYIRMSDWPYSPYNNMVHGFSQKKSIAFR